LILVIDNYDSFAYNLVQYLGELGQEPAAYRNDAITLEQIEVMAPSHIVISPGPCTPLEAGCHPALPGEDSYPGGVPGAPVHRVRVRGADKAGGFAHARKRVADLPRR